ncbi:TolC family protein [Taibaiella soli]|uniref:TolC family protein n=1 Tax=Taibaiella soli TaxID=1649169 RepID=A0A2W2AB41_9BACT|nr:TolC family protein [Taibaiella soli]PZF70812.1 TolC family protein [Taibaiella soli]
MSTIINKVTKFILGIVISLVSFTANAQKTLLDQYIAEAFQNNQGLHSQEFQLEKSLYALKEAQSMFLPNVSFLGSYTKTGGGRTIDFPIGDLLNPIYNSLNQLQGGENFPKVQNASFLLNPDNFYDAKFRTTLPLINAELWYNQQMKKEMIGQQQAAVNVYKRELVKNIKTAYFQYYQAVKAVDIYNNALQLVNENIRVNESMLRNGVRNSTALTRAETEKQKIDASINQAENAQKNAQAYFNFLLNRSLTTEISLDSAAFSAGDKIIDNASGDISSREELTQLNKTAAVYQLNKKIQQSYIVPKLNTFLDLGSQGYDWKYNNKTQYYMWGVNLQWDLFAAGRNHYKTQQATQDVKAVKAQYSETEQALKLQLEQVINNFNTATANFQAAQTQLQLAQKYYTDQLKMYKAGQLLYLELIDAQNQLTNAQLQRAVAFANVQIAQAGIERTIASYPLQNN